MAELAKRGLQLWPKGKVSFDMFNGFAGEFDCVRMTTYEERTNGMFMTSKRPKMLRKLLLGKY